MLRTGYVSLNIRQYENAILVLPGFSLDKPNENDYTIIDTGLAAYLLKWENPEVLERGAASGAFFESYVFSEIYKSFANAGQSPPIFYYRDRDQREIDLLIFQNGTLYPIEIKKSASPGAEAVKHFNILNPVTEPERFGALEQYKVEIGAGAVVCMANDLFPADRKNWLVPVWLI
jgi:predicted AAA+ superfamily ATPase